MAQVFSCWRNPTQGCEFSTGLFAEGFAEDMKMFVMEESCLLNYSVFGRKRPVLEGLCPTDYN